MKNKLTKDATKLAGRDYNVADYQNSDQLSKGLATTHEQVSDAYMEGEIQQVVENDNSKNIDISRKQ